MPANLANIREVVGLPMTWACCTHRREKDSLHVPPGGLTGLDSASTGRRAWPTKTSKPVLPTISKGKGKVPAQRPQLWALLFSERVS